MQGSLIIRKSDLLQVANNCVCADTVWLRMKGLLGRETMREGEALWIKPCNSIHTFFMQFPIDVVFLDKNKKIISISENIKPWRFSKIIISASSVIEFPSGVVKKTNLKINDELDFVNEISLHTQR